jgi:hypothetical protein
MRVPVAISVSGEKDSRERGERYKTREPARVEEVHEFLFKSFISVQKGSQGGDLECRRCWRSIVV